VGIEYAQHTPDISGIRKFSQKPSEPFVILARAIPQIVSKHFHSSEASKQQLQLEIFLDRIRKIIAIDNTYYLFCL